jgi:tRNA/rRNA methyltransferase
MTRRVLENVAVILVGVKYPGNIGAAARALANMGLGDLRLVAPRCEVDEEARRMARVGGRILDGVRSFRTLKAALRGVHLAVGTTAKTGGNRREVSPPRVLAPRILETAARQRVALVFGPEDTGLVDDDLRLCQVLARIPTTSSARSLNLAQAVMVFAYELHLGSRVREPRTHSELAAVEAVERMYAQLEEALLQIGFLHPQNARHMMFAFRRLFGRAGLTESDVGMLRGVARQVAWYATRHAVSAGSTTAEPPSSEADS